MLLHEQRRPPRRRRSSICGPIHPGPRRPLASPSRRPQPGPPPGVARQLASASGPRRVSGASRDGAGAGARPISEHKDRPDSASRPAGTMPGVLRRKARVGRPAGWPARQWLRRLLPRPAPCTAELFRRGTAECMTQWFLEQALPGFPERGLRCEGDGGASGSRTRSKSLELGLTALLPERFLAFPRRLSFSLKILSVEASRAPLPLFPT